MSSSIAKPILFGSFPITNQPILPGHVLVSPLRSVPRLRDLTGPEIADLFSAVQRVGRMVERVYSGTALTVSVQDGPAAGQSVAHVHAHILPRKFGDFDPPDDLYDKLNGEEGNIGSELEARRASLMDKRQNPGSATSKFVVDSEKREPRSPEAMEEEASQLRREMEAEIEMIQMEEKNVLQH